MFESDDEYPAQQQHQQQNQQQMNTNQHQQQQQSFDRDDIFHNNNNNATSSTFAPIEIEKGPMVDTTTNSFSSSPTVNMSSNVNTQFNIWENLTSCFSVDTYKKNFDVNTVDIKQRLVGSLLYFNVQNGFNSSVLGEKGPDVYGPFWITMTLVFFLAFTSNVNAYLILNSKNFEYDVGHIIRAMVVLFTFSFGLPSILYIILQCVSAPVALMNIIVLYGYSLVAYLPITIFCMIPNDVVVWLLLVFATIISLVFLLRNLSGLVLSQTSHEKAFPVLTFIICCHVILVLVLKIGFYHHVHKL